MGSLEPKGQRSTKYILLTGLAAIVIPAVLHYLRPPLQIEFNWGFPLGWWTCALISWLLARPRNRR